MPKGMTKEEKEKKRKERERQSRKLLGTGMAGRAASALVKRRAMLDKL